MALISILLVAFVLLLPAASPAAPAAPSGLQEQVRTVLRSRVPEPGSPPRLQVGERTFRASPGVACFYDQREHVPAWIGPRGVRPEAEELLAVLGRAREEGLRTEDYRAAALRRAASNAASPGDLADLDLLLTDAFLRYAADVRSGRVDPHAVDPTCAAEPDKADLPAMLEGTLTAGDLRRTLAELPPPHPEYRLLREALARYRRFADEGGWIPVPDGPTLRLDDQDKRVVVLRDRLAQAAAADAAPRISPSVAERDRFDEPLERAVRSFQERHGLVADGLVGPNTLRALNENAAAHVRQIELNMERWRWLPRDLGRRHVMVNIAGFWLEAVEDGRADLRMKVIVGKPYTRTPQFSDEITRVVVNPYWYVPNSIVTQEIIPRLRRDPGYFHRERFEVLDGWGGRALSPSRVDWSRYTKSGLVLRQKPGPQNALGRIKFLFPNRFNVYLHDTPADQLFERTVRTFSHGCIRVERPFELGAWILAEKPEWSETAIHEAVSSRENRSVVLDEKIPVHIIYLTSWVDGDGMLQMRRDVYNLDEPLDQTLGESANAA